MKFLANENVPLDAITALREKSHDVVWIRTDDPGRRDEDILSRAVEEARILITFDKDFGELAFRLHLPAKCGIILFRIHEKTSSYIANIVTTAIESRNDWAGHFTVVEEFRIRMKPLYGN
jgi:predicted nuclease of predicted toxin-antitoxin system